MTRMAESEARLEMTWEPAIEDHTHDTSCKILMSELRHVTEDLKELKSKFETAEKAMLIFYVNKDQFTPVKNVVYGLVGIILTSVIGAILLMVIKAR